MRQWQKPTVEPPRGGPGLELWKVEEDVQGLRQRLDQRLSTDEAHISKPKPSFGLEVAIAVLDQIVDSVFESLNAIRLEADTLEGKVLAGPGRHVPQDEEGPRDIPQQTLDIRRLLRQVRWSFLPSDEISELASGPFLTLSDPGIDRQLNDLCREADRAVETVRDVIDQVQQVVELSNSLKTDRLNQTIHVLTIAATVLLVPTLIAGLWGMNFDRVPGAGMRQGFWLALGILAIVAAGVAVAIRRWLHQVGKKGGRSY